jgi:hypothetical protein
VFHASGVLPSGNEISAIAHLSNLSAELSRSPAFPVRVPKYYIADFDQKTGTGILITERISFGSGGIEPSYGKCLDYELPDALAHYTAIVRALARLAAADKAGSLPDDVEKRFAFDPEQAIANDALPNFTSVRSRFNEWFRVDETARTQLHVITMLL